VYAILYCLPWVGRELYDKKEQTVERLMITIDNYMKKRKKTHLKMLRVWSSEEPHPQEEVRIQGDWKGIVRSIHLWVGFI
jgi:nuclear cap-binding protein subunit 1